MKKTLFLLAFIVFGTITLNAQDKDQVRSQDQDRDRLMLVDGDVLQIRDRDQIRLQDKVTLNDGTVINPDGTFQIRNRDMLRLKDGECLDADGILYRNEYQYRYKVNQENKGLNQAQVQERNQNRVHYTLVDGEVLQIRNQSQNRLQQQLNFANGGSVNPDGTYQTQNRKQLRLNDGECLNMNGELFKNTYQARKMVKKDVMNKKTKKQPNMKKKLMKKGG
ncbi:DUF6799 domain-containing protein [Aequorivita sp. CIP111184]|uniref:DUF6799 domain-containing protein n=1 Tax=Aequorivita sp. CIP111184 TaxID=2211356 RepID=UPI000DBBB8C0|nr:DUF6799 domain-containing protein [Aequorivita sp. CIP111184]SRX55464.1 hypothetical protein AEQU1_02486 [Aequorivita sp. CIP111184]